MNLSEKEKCRKLVSSFSPAFDRLGVWFVESDKYGFMLVTNYDEDDSCNITLCEAGSSDEFKEYLVREYTERRALDIIGKMPEEEAEMIEDWAWNENEAVAMLCSSDRDTIAKEVDSLLKKAEK